jgi:HlyD family secretion protein
LASQGFISHVALEESQDILDRQQFAVNEEKNSQISEEKVRRSALEQMETGINGLQSGLNLVTSSVEALAVRAPIDGKLTDFQLQVGESVSTGKRIGRIDDPTMFKLAALIDEFYLSRIAAGDHGNARAGDENYALQVMSVFPQIKEGRFLAELKFVGKHPEKINPGQSFDSNITLGAPSPALILPMGIYINDSGGTWVFVLSKDGKTAERRAIKIGQRSNRQVEILSGLSVGDKVIVSSYASYQTTNRLQLNHQ